MRNSQQKEYLDLLRYDMEAKRDRDRQQREEDLRQVRVHWKSVDREG